MGKTRPISGLPFIGAVLIDKQIKAFFKVCVFSFSKGRVGHRKKASNITLDMQGNLFGSSKQHLFGGRRRTQKKQIHHLVQAFVIQNNENNPILKRVFLEMLNENNITLA
ncbi:uncharacterized protein LOC144744313 [Ciona intestinalis]